MLNVRKIADINEFNKLKNEWEKLLADSGIDNPYLTHSWFRIAYEHFEKKSELFILLVYDKTDLIAIAPLLIAKKRLFGFSLKQLRFLENVHTPFQDFIIKRKHQETLSAIVDYLQKNYKQWDFMELKEIKSNSENITFLQDLCEAESDFQHQFTLSRSWSVSTNMTWKKRSTKMKSKFKRNIRRRVRRLEEHGELYFKIITDSGSYEEHLEQFFSIHDKTWKGKEHNAEFYYKIANEFAKSDQFAMYCLYLNERPIAYMFGLKYNKELFGIKTTYDPTYTVDAPGIYMFYKIVEASCNAKDINQFDIGRGDERYKVDLTCRPIEHIIFVAGHKKTLSSYAYHIRFKTVLYLKKKKILVACLTFIKKSNIIVKKIQDYFKQNLLSQRTS